MTDHAKRIWLRAIAIVAKARNKCAPGERFEALNLVMGDLEDARRRDQLIMPDFPAVCPDCGQHCETHNGESDCAALQSGEAQGQVASLTPDDLIDLIGEFGREVYHLLDDCETSGPVGEEIHTITEDGLRKVSAILDRIEAMPFEEPGVMLGTGAMLQAAIMQTFAHPPRTGGRRQMKVLIVGGPNRGQVVDVEATPSNMLELVRVLDPVRGEAFWFKVEADVKDKHSYVIGELCRAYEFVTKGETRRQHVGENGKL